MVVERSPLLLASTYPNKGDPMANNLGYDQVQTAYIGKHYIWGDEGWKLVGPALQ